MDKVKLILNNEKLSIINLAWQLISKQNLDTPEQKLLYDITLKLAKKFKKKFIEKEYNDAEFSMELAYYEAYFLNQALNIQLLNLNIELHPYEYNVVFQTINFLHQKLI